MHNFSMSLAGCDIIEEIEAGVNTIIYRTASADSAKRAIVKLLKSEYPTLEEIIRFKHEFQILRHLDNLEGIVRAYSLETYKNRLALILEDFGGESLKNYLNAQKLESLEFLKIAIQIASALAEVHKKHVIHKDIKPQNILINPKTGEVKLSDFSIATRLERENAPASHPNVLEGTLAYMSPEQTGRMNRSIDYRTDLYSLGLTFYEILTGELPCTNADPLELVYCHIAQKIIPPQALNPEIPTVISDIVMKLLAKNAEDRYQSAEGLKFDLETCLVKLEATGYIDEFVVASADKASQLNIPQKLYGREAEVKKLLETFVRVANGTTELMLVSGYSGIGKTVLVNEVHKPITAQRGYFIAGKFDQFKRNIPHASLIQAFQSLILQLLTESEGDIKIWKEKLLAALSVNGQIIVDVIPEVELIIGKQPEVPQLGATETQNRFNRVFQQFIGAIAQKEHPLVLFLDDLQWADSASLKSIELIMTNADSKHLLLIGAYRDNEVSPTHAAIQAIEKIQQAGTAVSNIVLQPLDLSNVCQLVGDTLGIGDEPLAVETRTFASLLFNTTGGNPFFLTQLLSTLHQEKLLNFNFSEGRWEWCLEKIQGLGIADINVVELVARNIQKLPEISQQILKLAACIGNRFSLDVLAIAFEKSQSETAIALWDALQAGLVLPASDAYKIPLLAEGAADSLQFPIPHSEISYKFLHDRVQQAAYSLIPENQKKATHLKIGQLLLEKTAEAALEENIFDIVNQLNVGADLIAHPAEKEQLAKLNLIAGRKAKAATACESAVRYLNAGLEMLSDSSWLTHYELTLSLYIETAESEYLNTNFERAALLEEIVLERAKTLLEKIKIYELKIQFCMSQNQLIKAIETGLAVADMLGVPLSPLPGEGDVPIRLPRLQDLDFLPLMTDPYQLAAMRIFLNIAASACVAEPATFVQVIFTMVNLCIKYGNSALAAFAYADFAMILSGSGHLDSGYRAGQLALRLLEQFNAKELKSKVYAPFNSYTRHWKEPVKSTLPSLLEGIQSGLETGDYEYASICAIHYCNHIFWVGDPLDFIQKQQEARLDWALKLKQELSVNFIKLWHQLTLNLEGEAEDVCWLIGSSFNEKTMVPYLQETKNTATLFHFFVAKAILYFLFKKHGSAIEAAYSALEYVGGARGMLVFAAHNFYYSLALLAQYNNANLSEKQDYLNKVDSHQINLRKWADSAPCNYQNKYELVEAEKARILGQDVRAMEYYDRAIKGAAEQGFTHEEAIACELAAEFYFSRDREKVALVYLTDAYYAYIRWGATAKVQDLEERYPQFFSKKLKREAFSMESSPTTSSTTSTGIFQLDITTIMKASQALAGEIVLDKLLSKLMLIVRENAGAQKGYLILEKDGELFIEATISEGEDKVKAGLANNLETTQITPLQNPPSSNLPLSLINYVRRTRENLVLNDACAESPFSADPYIATSQSKSILCTPLIHQGKLVGLLYLENNLTKGAFTSDRLEVLRLLSSQAAISIENARLYANLEKAKDQLQDYSKTLEIKVEERTLELKEKNDNLQREIRDRLLAEEALRLSEERFRAIFESTDDFIAVWDKNFNCLYANQAWLNSIQKSRHRVIGKNVREIFPDSPEAIILWMSRFQTVFNTCKSLYFEDVDNAGDRPSYSESTLSPIKDSTGNVFAVGVVYRDITERKLAEAALQRSEAQLRKQATDLQQALDELRRTQIQLIQNEKMASLGQLVGGVAHEINNPASFIYGNLAHAKEYIQNLFYILQLYQKHYPEPVREIQEQAEENDLDFIIEDLPKLLDSMQVGVKRISSIVLSLRNFSRLDESNLKQVDIHEGIENALLILQNRLNSNAERPAIEIIKEYGNLPEVECYVGHLNQVFMNILTNAIDALEEAHAQKTITKGSESGHCQLPTIRIRTEIIDSDKVAVRIIDNGCGFTEEVKKYIFDPLFTTKPVGQGTGLGLSISYKIVVEKHGGNLEAISVSGQGAEFIIEIPRQQLTGLKQEPSQKKL